MPRLWCSPNLLQMCHVCGAHAICACGQNNGHNLRVPMTDSRVVLASDEDAERDLKTRFDSRAALASGEDAERDLTPELLLLRVGVLSEI